MQHVASAQVIFEIIYFGNYTDVLICCPGWLDAQEDLTVPALADWGEEYEYFTEI